MQDHERFRIEDVAEDGKPTAPEVVATKFGEDNLDVSTFLNNSGEGDPLFTGVDNLFEVEGVAFREGEGDALCNREDDRSGEVHVI